VIAETGDSQDGATAPEEGAEQTEPAEVPRARRRSKQKRNIGEETRCKLLDAARDLGEELPPPKITVETVASRAGVSRATFYLYFEDKDDIYLELAREACDILYSEASRSPESVTPRDSIVSATRGYAEALARVKPVLRFLYAIAPSDERFGELLTSVRERFYLRIAGNLERGIKQGDYRKLQVAETARALGGMAEHLLVEELLEGRLPPVEPAVEVVADIWYRAITAD